MLSLTQPNPLPVIAGLTIYPDFADFSNWFQIPVATGPAGDWIFWLTLPQSILLVNIPMTMQVWFPGTAGITSGQFSNGLLSVIGI